jgi:Na+/phosphate symporter
MRMRAKRCASDSGILYIELLGEIRKVSRHLANIAERSDSFR